MYQPPKPSENFQHLNDAQLDGDLQSARRAADALRLQLQQLQDELARSIERVDELGEEQVRRVLAAAAVVGAKPDWAWLLELVPFHSASKYQAAGAALCAGLPEAPGNLIWLSGTTADAKQHLIEIALVHGAPQLTAAVSARLHEVLPVMRLQPQVRTEDDERPYKRISLLEKTLSQRASYYLAINEEAGMYQVRACTNGRGTVIENCDSFDSLLKRVEEEYYYRKLDA